MYLLLDEYHLSFATDEKYKHYKKYFVLDKNVYSKFGVVRLGSLLKFMVHHDVLILELSYQEFLNGVDKQLFLSRLLYNRLQSQYHELSDVSIQIIEQDVFIGPVKKQYTRFFPYWKVVRKDLKW